MNHHHKKLLAALVLTLCAPIAHAGEEFFPETYLADTLPKGVFEAEEGVTWHGGKAMGTYNLWQTRSEIEYGITDRWLISGYINTYSVDAQNDNSQASRNDFAASSSNDDIVNGGGPATVGEYVPSSSTFAYPAAHFSRSDFDSLSLETIFRFLSPYTDPLGLSAYFEYTRGEHSEELEFKLLAQKNFLEDRLVLAANAVLEVESNAYSQTGEDQETELELTGGASFRFAEDWRAGAEIRNIHGYDGHTIDSAMRSYSVWYAGPIISYTSQRWFATLGYERQLPWAEAYDQAAQLEQVSGMNYKDAEANFVRLKMGVNFK